MVLRCFLLLISGVCGFSTSSELRAALLQRLGFSSIPHVCLFLFPGGTLRELRATTTDLAECFSSHFCQSLTHILQIF